MGLIYLEDVDEKLNNGKQNVICDTNVWYRIGDGRYVPPSEVDLISTFQSFAELATTTNMIGLPLYQQVVQAIYGHATATISVSPFDYVLQNQFEDYQGNSDKIKEIITGFTRILKMDMSTLQPMDKEFLGEVERRCTEYRKPQQDFADMGNAELPRIQNNLKKKEARKAHLANWDREGLKNFIKFWFDTVAGISGYNIDWDVFDWTQIELFMCVTESFFKKLETTVGMKIKTNDVPDWFNLMYTKPGKKYLSFDEKWTKRIYEDERVRHYLHADGIPQ